MIKDIWHTKNETPRQESRVLWKSDNVVCGGRFDTHYKCFCGPASQFVDLRKVSRWCYVDDLLALETELAKCKKTGQETARTKPHIDRIAWRILQPMNRCQHPGNKRQRPNQGPNRK